MKEKKKKTTTTKESQKGRTTRRKGIKEQNDKVNETRQNANQKIRNGQVNWIQKKKTIKKSFERMIKEYEDPSSPAFGKMPKQYEG